MFLLPGRAPSGYFTTRAETSTLCQAEVRGYVGQHEKQGTLGLVPSFHSTALEAETVCLISSSTSLSTVPGTQWDLGEFVEEL